MIATGADLRAKSFAVTSPSGRVVLRGRLRRAPGAAKPWGRAFHADLSRVTEPGSYRVRVGRLRSRPWRVTPNASRRAIVAMLGFFAVNRDGDELSPIHGPAHLNDAVVASGPREGERLDLAGGWMDAPSSGPPRPHRRLAARGGG